MEEERSIEGRSTQANGPRETRVCPSIRRTEAFYFEVLRTS
jgi:hypothetical protein